MKTLALVLLLAASSAAAHAQTSVYAAPMFDVFGFTGGQYGNGSFKSATGGITGGGFYTFPSQSRFKAGLDGRISYSPGYKGGQAYTGALRVSFVPNHNRLRPYLQLGGGAVSTQLSQTTCSFSGFSTICNTQISRVTSGALQLDFGLDVRLTQSLDLRALDYGADAGGSSGSAVRAGTGFLDAGIVYHFHSAKHS